MLWAWELEIQDVPVNEKLTPAQQEEFEERAAILEFEGGMSREDAEKRALELTLAKINQTAQACRHD